MPASGLISRDHFLLRLLDSSVSKQGPYCLGYCNTPGDEYIEIHPGQAGLTECAPFAHVGGSHFVFASESLALCHFSAPLPPPRLIFEPLLSGGNTLLAE